MSIALLFLSDCFLTEIDKVKKIAFIFILISTSFFSLKGLSQDGVLQITKSNGDLIENGSFLYKTNNLGLRVIYSDTLCVKNTSGATINLKIRKIAKNVSFGTFNKFEALGQFLQPDESITPNSWELQDGESLPEDAYFFASYYHQTLISTSSIVYSFLSVDENNQVLDSVFVEYAFSNTSITPFNSDGEALYHREILVNCDIAETNEYQIELYNHSSNDLYYRVGRKIEDLEDGQEVSFWFGGLEYGMDENASIGEGLEIKSETTPIGDEGFKAIFSAHGVDANQTLSKVKYKFFNKDDGRDADYVTLIYNPSEVGLPQTDELYISKAYPNPASAYFNIDYHLSVFQNASIKLYQNRGSFICQYPIKNNKGSLQISIQDFPIGIYYYTLEIDGKPIGVEKIIKE